MNAIFVAHGVLFAAAGIIAARAFSSATGRARVAVSVLAVVHALGMLLVGVFHGSLASVENGTIVLHVLGAAAAIISGNLVVIVAGVASTAIGAPSRCRVASIVLGVVGLISLIMLELDSGSTAFTVFAGGAWERPRSTRSSADSS